MLKERAPIGFQRLVLTFLITTPPITLMIIMFLTNAGLYAKLPVTSNIAIQPILLHDKGAKWYTTLFWNGTAQFKSGYVEITVLLVMNLTDNFNIQFGPYAALW
jgi:hypothetical protein